MNIKFNELFSEIGKVLQKWRVLLNHVSITHSKSSVFPTITQHHVKRKKKNKATQLLTVRIIDFKHISPLCLSHYDMEIKLSEGIKSFSFHIMYIQSHFGSLILAACLKNIISLR